MTRATWFVCGLAALVAAGWTAWAWADGKYEQYEHQMERVHKGKRSPYKSAESLLNAETPNFADVTKTLPDLQAMAKALKESKHKDIKDAADGYFDAVAELATAVGKQDRDASRAAFKKLSKSCEDCHYKDGPGGRLEK